MRVNRRIRFEYASCGQVNFLNPERKSCGFKNIRALSSKIILNYFQLFEMKDIKAKCKIWKRKKTKPHFLNTISMVYFLQTACLIKRFLGRVLSIQVFSALGGVFTRSLFNIQWYPFNTTLCYHKQCRDPTFTRYFAFPICSRYKIFCEKPKDPCAIKTVLKIEWYEKGLTLRKSHK